VYPPLLIAVHCPPFPHGKFWQGLMTICSQLVPKNPLGQLQLYPLLAKAVQEPPLIQGFVEHPPTYVPQRDPIYPLAQTQ